MFVDKKADIRAMVKHAYKTYFNNSTFVQQDEDIRIIVGGFSENVARKVLCEVSYFKDNW